MYEVASRTRKVNGVDVETWEREIIDANILSVEAGTNGYQGGDTGHGGRTYIRISDEGGTDISAKVIKDRYGDTSGIEIALGGNAELSTMIEALKFITKVLEEGREAATETIEEYRKMTKAQQANVKDKGGFVAGHLKGGRRKKNTVLCRSALALDMDYGTPDVWDEVIAQQPYRCCAYSTHKHTAEKPRLRIVIPLSRDVSEAEYPAVARMAAKDIGIDLFDDSTFFRFSFSRLPWA